MREVYACRLELSDQEGARTTARALTRYWIGSQYGGWPELDGPPWIPEAGAVVTWRVLTDDATGDALTEYVWRRPSEDDATLVRRTVVEVAREHGHDWVLVRESLESVDPTLVEGGPQRHHRPGVVPLLVERLRCVDGGWRLARQPRSIDAATAMELDAFVRGGRRLPVVVVSPGPRGQPLVDADDLAARLVGVAHVALLQDVHAASAFADEIGARHAPLDGAVQVLWPRWRSDDPVHRHRRWHPEEATRAVVEIERAVLDVAALRIPEPVLLPRLLAARARQRASELTRRPARDDAALAAAALTELEQALDDADLLRAQVTEREAENAVLADKLQELQRSYGALRDEYVRVAGDQQRVQTVYDVVAEVQRSCRHLVVLPSALESASRARFERPDELARQLRLLDEVSALRMARQLKNSFADACRDRGLNWAAAVSDSATDGHPNDYTVTHEGRSYTLGPHLRLNHPDGPVRIYCDFSGDLGPVVVGHVGRHLPDRTT